MRLLLYLVDNPPNMRIKAKAFGISQPLGAGYIAAVLRQDGHEVRILDSSVSVLSQEQFKKYILDYAPDMMGFTAFTFSVKQCLEKAREVKEVNPRIKIIFGGPHATYLGEEIMADRCVDMVVRGEGEQTMREIARAFSSGSTFAQVKGLLYKDGEGRILRNPDRELADDLDAIPFPAYDLMDMNKYYSSVNRRFTNRGFAGIITARGCPYLCTFCSHKMFGRKPRLRSPENVVDEI